MGTPEYARRPLSVLCNSRHEILAVVTGEAKRTRRSKKLVPTAVYDEATRHELKVYTPTSLKDSKFHREIKTLKPDLIVVVAFRILPEELFTIPKYGSVNIHASLLPKYRGPAPINWALINGETETGLSSFFLKKKVDTGNLIMQEKVVIDEKENFDSLYSQLSELSGPFLLKTIDSIENGEVKPIVQDDKKATPAPKINSFDALIDFGFPATKVKNFIRGLATRPGAYTYFRHKKIKLHSCVTSEKAQPGVPPGTVLPDRKRLLIQCADMAIEVLSLVPEGKKEMSGLSFKNGFRPETGEIFGRIKEKVDEN